MSQQESYVIDIEEGEEAFAKLHTDWRELWSQSNEASESQTWEWQYWYWKCLAPKCHPLVIVARDRTGHCLALAAFFARRDRRSGLRVASFLGEHDADYHMILCRPRLPEAVGSGMLEALLQRVGPSVSFIELSNVPVATWTGKVLQSFLGVGAPVVGPVRRWESQTYAVPLPRTVTQYVESLGPRTQRAYEYDARRLARDFNVGFRAYVELGDLESALDAIETVHRARWGAGSYWNRPADRTFHRMAARRFCEMGVYRAFVLYLNGDPAAFVAGVLVRGSFKVPQVGYDPTVPSRYSVGKVMHFKVIEYCINDGYLEYDLTRGSEGYKRMLGGQLHCNLHARLYRSRLDLMVEPVTSRVVPVLRRQSWLQGLCRLVAGRGAS